LCVGAHGRGKAGKKESSTINLAISNAGYRVHDNTSPSGNIDHMSFEARRRSGKAKTGARQKVAAPVTIRALEDV
jgi:hypothetical protein